jgi:hypothetical protein
MQFLFGAPAAAYLAGHEASSGPLFVSDIKVTPPGAPRSAADPAPRLPRRTPVSRHGAISRDLTKYSSYKTWAEKARGAFATEDVPATNGSNHGRRSADR